MAQKQNPIALSPTITRINIVTDQNTNIIQTQEFLDNWMNWSDKGYECLQD